MRPLVVIPATLLLGCHLLLPVGGAPPDQRSPDTPDQRSPDTPDQRSPDTLDLRSRETPPGLPSCSALAVDAGPLVTSACCNHCGDYTGTGRVVWPSAVGAVDPVQCLTDSGGCKTTGVCAATFFRYGSCPEWKEYDLPAGCKDVVIWGCSDGCKPGNVLKDVTFAVEELQGGSWAQTKSFIHPELNDTCDCKDDQYTATSSKLRIRSTGTAGFYVCLFVR